MLRNDLQISANLRSGTEAFYLSAAGVEWAKREIAQTTNFPPALLDQSKNFASGQFSVEFLSSSVAEPFAARVVLRSTGTSHGAQQVLQAQLTKLLDLVDAALAVRGSASRVNFDAAAIAVSGVDHDAATGAAIADGKSRNALSAGDAAVRELVLQALGDPPRQDVFESGPEVPPVATSSYLSSEFVAQLADQLCTSAQAVVHTIPSTGTLAAENQTWGARTAPQLHCVEGSSTAGDAATLGGTFMGAGILIVKNADLILTGTARWEGLILVSGADISLKTIGTGNKDLLGGVVVNETAIPGSGRAILDFQGTVRLLFSRTALSQVLPLLPAAVRENAHQWLPATVAQDYWRAVTP
jgi:hypothetical protein